MKKTAKNYTFSLPVELLDKLKKYSEAGYVSSVNSAVKEAVEAYVVKTDKQILFSQMNSAAQDPLFIKDLDEAMRDFSYSDYEATREKEE